MKTRKNFLRWIEILDNSPNYAINHPKFYNIHEKDYVYEVLGQVAAANANVKAFVDDYMELEDQRYQIIANNAINENTSIFQIETAIQFCSKTDDNKRRSTFVINPNLSNYLARSSFPWNDITNKNPTEANSHYLFIPSFLSIAPKEICLSGFNALLLDIKDFREEFSYGELFELIKDVLNLQENDLDKVLLEFISNQVLYYRTILPV